MTILAKLGDFCSNEKCTKYPKMEANPASRISLKQAKTKTGVRRYEYKTCRQTFAETKVTMFYRKRTPMDEVLETVRCWLKEIVLKD